MLPKSTIIISKNGSSQIIGKEKSDNCYELSELGKAAGKVTKDDDLDHTPVHQNVHNSERR